MIIFQATRCHRYAVGGRNNPLASPLVDILLLHKQRQWLSEWWGMFIFSCHVDTVWEQAIISNIQHFSFFLAISLSVPRAGLCVILFWIFIYFSSVNMNCLSLLSSMDWSGIFVIFSSWWGPIANHSKPTRKQSHKERSAPLGHNTNCKMPPLVGNNNVQ